tara:strand:+ start:3150 stop:4247 length:1098 start_codon:yes stop_codon:yes gene_type:complete
MLDALKSLFENNVLSEQVRSDLEEAWNAKVNENRIAATAELREEFAKKYAHDKSTMVEAIDAMISEKLTEEIAEFQADRKQLAETKAKFAIAQRQNANLMKTFVSEALAKEIKELHSDQRAMTDKFVALEEFVVESLAKEIAEFYEDKKDLAETKVRLVREGKAHISKVRNDFIKKSAALVSETVSRGLKKEISSLKEDIDQARQNDFGRKLFEAFANEYTHSYLNENSETAKLLKVVDAKDRQLAEAKQTAVKAIKLAESKTSEIKMITESSARKDTLNKLVAPLSKEQQNIMMDLLESVQTTRLQSQFEKYLPAVIGGKVPAPKAILSEGKEITGNREMNNDSIRADADSKNVIDIKRLAGLS